MRKMDQKLRLRLKLRPGWMEPQCALGLGLLCAGWAAWMLKDGCMDALLLWACGLELMVKWGWLLESSYWRSWLISSSLRWF